MAKIRVSLFSIGELDTARKKILILLMTFAVLDAAAAIFLYNSDQLSDGVRTAVTDIEVTITAGIAAGFAIIVVARQGLDGLHGRTYAALAIGAIMWFVGEILWTYQEVIMQIDLPAYSMADVFWLLGYPFFGYHLLKTYKYFSKSVNKAGLAVISSGAGILISILIYQIFNVSDFGTIDGIMTSMFRASYPIGDLVLIIPSVLLLVTLRKAKLHFTPWFFISVALLITACADSLFSYLSLIGQIETEWVANLLYDLANLGLAGGLYWYNRFIVFDEKRAQKKA